VKKTSALTVLVASVLMLLGAGQLSALPIYWQCDYWTSYSSWVYETSGEYIWDTYTQQYWWVPGGEVIIEVATQNGYCHPVYGDPDEPDEPPTPIMTAANVWIISVDASEPMHTAAYVGVQAASNANCSYDDIELFVGNDYNDITTQAPTSSTIRLGNINILARPVGATYISVRAYNATCGLSTTTGFTLTRTQSQTTKTNVLDVTWLEWSESTGDDPRLLPVPGGAAFTRHLTELFTQNQFDIATTGVNPRYQLLGATSTVEFSGGPYPGSPSYTETHTVAGVSPAVSPVTQYTGTRDQLNPNIAVRSYDVNNGSSCGYSASGDSEIYAFTWLASSNGSVTIIPCGILSSHLTVSVGTL
jgi:hypothetical protein